jgi:hypothetical protein
MELQEKYPAIIEEWKHEGIEKFMGGNTSHMNFELGISKPDIYNSCVYFMVKVRLVYTNDFNGEVFHAVTSTTFRISYGRDSLSVPFLFELVDKATYDFAEIFHERKQKTNLFTRKIERPVLDEMRDTIQAAIDVWDEPAVAFKNEFGERLTRFKNLPPIPEHKLYNDTLPSTMEQRISLKLHMHQEIDDTEKEIFEGLSLFYKKLDEELALLDYSSFSPQDITDFKNYLSYAFNFVILITNQLSIYKVYRLVVNESGSQKNDSIIETRFLTYPGLDIVKRYGNYNRGNTCNTTVFYVAEDIDTALKEIRPEKGKRVTVGVWKPKKDRTFTSYPIVHYEQAIANNKEVEIANSAIRQIEETHHTLFRDYMNYYLKLLSREYSKPITNRFDYMISAIFSEQIFKINDGNPDYNYDCILYPSVGNEFQTRNIIIKPSVVDEDFILDKVIEFEISDSFYDRKPLKTGNPEDISLANVRHYRETRNISPDGVIAWSNYIKKENLD